MIQRSSGYHSLEYHNKQKNLTLDKEYISIEYKIRAMKISPIFKEELRNLLHTHTIKA
ncbi:MAG: hypothetical protein AAF770_01140 [Bacteroidota bacterium]